jgi:hypothetical protein
MHRCRVFIIATVGFFFFAVFTKNAYAYLDLGTGSYIFQIVIAFMIGGLYAIKLFWKKVLFFMRNLFRINRK